METDFEGKEKAKGSSVLLDLVYYDSCKHLTEN